MSYFQNLGHEVVPFQPPFVEAALKLWIDLLMCDGGANLLKTLEGEKIDPSLEYFMDTVKVPAKLREIGKPFIQYLYGEHGSDMLGKKPMLLRRTVFITEILISWIDDTRLMNFFI